MVNEPGHCIRSEAAGYGMEPYKTIVSGVSKSEISETPIRF